MYDWSMAIGIVVFLALLYIATCGWMRLYVHNKKLEWQVKNGLAEEVRLGGDADAEE